MAAQLRTRKPTGTAPLPIVIVAGVPKSGKSTLAAQFTGDERIGQAWWLDIGEGSGDEYAAVPGARFDMIDHDGSWSDILGQVDAVIAQPRIDGKPNLLVIDTMSAVWDMLSAQADAAARSSKANRERLAKDPNYEVQVTMDKWNKAKARHTALLDKLKGWRDGIAVLIARADMVAVVDGNGKPVEGAKVWRIEGEKKLPGAANAIVRCTGPGEVEVVGSRGVAFLEAGVICTPDAPAPLSTPSLAYLVWDVMKVNPAARGREITALDQTGDAEPQAPAPQPEPRAEPRERPSRQERAAAAVEDDRAWVATEAKALRDGWKGEGDHPAVVAIREVLNGRQWVDLSAAEVKRCRGIIEKHSDAFDTSAPADEPAAEAPEDVPVDETSDEPAEDGEPETGPTAGFAGGSVDDWVEWVGQWGWTKRALEECIGEVSFKLDELPNLTGEALEDMIVLVSSEAMGTSAAAAA